MPAAEAQTQPAEALELAGSWDEAEAVYAGLYHGALAEGDLSRAAVLLRKRAWTLWEQARYDEAEDLAELSWAIATCHDEPACAAYAINTVAASHFARGDLPASRALYGEARELAAAAGDDELVGFTAQNLGVIANIAGELREARALYLESIGSTVRSGDRRTAVKAYNNLAMVSADLRDWMEAEVYFGRAIEIADRLGDVPMLAKLHANAAEPLIRIGSHGRAREMLDRAERLAAAIDHPATLADVARFRGVLAREEGDLAGAFRLLDESLALADRSGAWLARAEAMEELARTHWAGQARTDAWRTLEEAREVFLRSGAAMDVERVDALRAEWTLTGAAGFPPG